MTDLQKRKISSIIIVMSISEYSTIVPEVSEHDKKSELRHAVLYPTLWNSAGYSRGRAFFETLNLSDLNVHDSPNHERSSDALHAEPPAQVRERAYEMFVETDVVHVIWSAEAVKGMKGSFGKMMLGLHDARVIHAKDELTVVFLRVDKTPLPWGFEDVDAICMYEDETSDHQSQLRAIWTEAATKKSA